MTTPHKTDSQKLEHLAWDTEKDLSDLQIAIRLILTGLGLIVTLAAIWVLMIFVLA